MAGKTYEGDTLCWSCTHAVRVIGKHECPWAWGFVPVRGWTAEPTEIDASQGGTTSYLVKKCPMYKYDGKDANAEREAIQNRRKEKLALHKEKGTHPRIRARTGKWQEECGNCKYFAITEIEAKKRRLWVRGLCEYSKEDVPTTASNACIAWEKGDPKYEAKV